MIAFVALIALLLGWFGREVLTLLVEIKNRLEPSKKPSESKHEDSIGVGEPLTAHQLAAIEDKERIKKLNPTLYE